MDATQADRETRLLAEGRELMLQQVMAAEDKGAVGSLPYQNYLIRQVLTELAADIKRDQGRKSQAGSYKKFALYLGTIDPNIAALRAIQALLEALFRTGAADIPQPVYKQAAYNVGKAVYAEYLMRNFKLLNPKIFNSLVREYDKSMTRDERHLLKAFTAKFQNEGYDFPTWEFGDVEHVGMYLMSRMVHHGFIESWTKTERKKGKAYTVRYAGLAPHLRSASLEIMDVIASAPKVAGALIEPPLPWEHTANGGGGYHTVGMQRLMPYAVQNNGPKPVSPMLIKSLNILQSVAWTINQPVLQAVRQLSLKRDVGDVVGADPGPFPEFVEGCSDEEKKVWKGVARSWYTDKKTRAVKHGRAQRVFRDAQELAQYPSLWFAYFADSRTRKYARASSVSPQGTDLEKGVMRLTNGVPITSKPAARWFRVHGANKWGNDKDTLTEREQWVLDNDEFIVRMGTDPLAFTEWADADCPVQFLAWAMEYAAWRADPVGFKSHLPLGQDGTCNGLQNFSALMLDEVGGRAVNLLPGDKPRDIYLDVADRVFELLEMMPQCPLRDAWIAHGMNRKITKRTTMTLPYGCTRFACSTFINDDYLMVHRPPEIKPEDYGDAANYLSHVMWRALDDVVVKAREVMEWLKGWSKHTAQAGLPVCWIAPNGQRVVSQYERMKVKEIKSVAFNSRIKLFSPEEGVTDLKKVANAVAPNFVHSLDASHLDRVIIRCHEEGILLVAIHDDFGTYAEYTERLHRIIREEFVAMYEGNTILADMAAYSGYEVPPPAVGKLDLQLILQSDYFFA